MALRARIQILIALAFAASSLIAFAAPAAAETVLTPCTGTCGYWEVYDASSGMKGALCLYRGALGLDSLPRQRTLHRGQISCVVFNQRNLHSSPLVLGSTRRKRWSRATAKRSARAKALNMASI